MQTKQSIEINWNRQIGPKSCPAEFKEVCWAFLWGWQIGHGIAWYTVPKIGKTYWSDWDGCILCTAENARELHETLCFEAELHEREFSPFESKARSLNEHADPELAWQAYEEGVRASVFEDLSNYTLEDYL